MEELAKKLQINGFKAAPYHAGLDSELRTKTQDDFLKEEIDVIVATIATKKAEGYVDSGVKILIAVVIGALLLAGLYALFNTTIMPTVTTKITELFSYNG